MGFFPRTGSLPHCCDRASIWRSLFAGFRNSSLPPGMAPLVRRLPCPDSVTFTPLQRPISSIMERRAPMSHGQVKFERLEWDSGGRGQNLMRHW